MHVKSISWRQLMQFRWATGRRKLWWAIGAGVVVLLIASIAVTAPGSHRGVRQTSAVAPAHGPASSVTTSDALAASSSSGFATTTLGSAAGSTAQSGSAASGSAASGSAVKGAAQGAATSAGQPRLVIETANVDLTVSHLSKVTRNLSSLTAKSGGFIQSMNESTNPQGLQFESFTIRVPENKFQSVLKNVKSSGKINTFSQTGQDVTNEHNNLQLQISELQSEAQAYTRLFDKATKMSDMLQIQQSLTQVNNQISNLNNQLHQLNHTVQYATIHMTLRPSVVPILQGNEPYWAPLAQSLRFMARVGVGLSKVVGWILPWGILGGILYGIVRVWRRGRARKV